MKIDLNGIPGFKADGPPANDWPKSQPFPVLKIVGAFAMMVATVALVCAALWLAVA